MGKRRRRRASVGPCSTQACRASRSSTSSCPGRPLASGGSSRRPRRRADSTGYWLCPTPLRAAPRTWPWPPHRLHRPATPATPQSARPSTPGAPRFPRGTMHGWSRRPLTRPPDHLPQVRRGCPLPPAPPGQRRAGRAGAGRAGVVAVVLVVAVVIAAAVLFAPSLLTLRNAEPAPQAPPVVVVPAPSPGDDGTSSPAPSAAPSRAAEPVPPWRRASTNRPCWPRCRSGRLRGSRRPRRPGPGPASSSTSPTARPGC